MDLRRLLKPMALALVGGVFVLVFAVSDNATVAGLADAGILACPKVGLACEVRVSEQMLSRLDARGADGGRHYRRVVLDGRDCQQGGLGLVVTDRRAYLGGAWRGALDIIDGRCVVVAEDAQDDGGDGFKELPLECGCRGASGVCRYQLDDGGSAAAPSGVTLGPGYPPYEVFVGAGCVRKSCVEFFGDPSWPESCPGG